MPLTPEQRSLRAQIAAFSRRAKGGYSRETGVAGQEGLRAKFAREIDPDGKLPALERELRVDAAVKAHMARMRLASSRARKPGEAA